MTRDRVTLRRARAEEWEALRDLRLESLKTDPLAFGSTLARELAYPEARWRETAAEGAEATDSSTWVAEGADGRLVGMIVAARVEGKDHLFAMWVAPRVRHQGVGARLLDAALTWMWARDPASIVRLAVNPRQEAAIALYRSRGFRPTGVRQALGPGHPPEEVADEMELLPDRVSPGAGRQGGVSGPSTSS